MSDGLNSTIEELKAQVDTLWNQMIVRKENEAFTPITKNVHLRKAARLKTLVSKPLVPLTLYGYHRGIVVDTRDPLKKGRVRVYVPMVHAQVPESDLPWALKAEFWGSLEDQGSVFTPPAGSTVWVTFEAGNRFAPIVTGCLWNTTRSKKSGAEGGLLLIEERTRWGGAPGKRVDEKNPETNSDMKYLMPPWNNESYRGKDVGSRSKGNLGRSPAYPHISGFKSPEKHFLQMVDGDFEQKLAGKRFVMQSSRGSVLFMKDDGINEPDKIFSNPMWDDFKDAYPGLKYSSAKPYNDHKIELKNTGLQLQSFGGHRLVLSDETLVPPTSNDWNEPFTPGKPPNDKFRTFITLESITEHKIMLIDNEKEPEMRSPTDGIFLVTATGNYIGLRDDTNGSIAGQRRGILMWSTSNHTFEMNDFTTPVSRPRKGDGTVYYSEGLHKNEAKLAYVRTRSGFGQIIELNDLGSQQQNANQFILIRNENKEEGDCPEVGPPWNFIQMFCETGDKFFHIWGAGTFHINVCNFATRTVHNRDDRVFVMKGNKYTRVFEGIMIEHAERLVRLWSTYNRIDLWVGRIINKKLEFPPHPVVIAKEFWRCPFTQKIHNDTPSKHVFASE